MVMYPVGHFMNGPNIVLQLPFSDDVKIHFSIVVCGILHNFENRIRWESFYR